MAAWSLEVDVAALNLAIGTSSAASAWQKANELLGWSLQNRLLVDEVTLASSVGLVQVRTTTVQANAWSRAMLMLKRGISSRLLHVAALSSCRKARISLGAARLVFYRTCAPAASALTPAPPTLCFEPVKRDTFGSKFSACTAVSLAVGSYGRAMKWQGAIHHLFSARLSRQIDQALVCYGIQVVGEATERKKADDLKMAFADYLGTNRETVPHASGMPAFSSRVEEMRRILAAAHQPHRCGLVFSTAALKTALFLQFTVAPWPAETELQSQTAKRARQDSACWNRQRRLQDCIMSSIKIAISIFQNPVSTETH
eukprot:s4528_g2.t1